MIIMQDGILFILVIQDHRKVHLLVLNLDKVLKQENIKIIFIL